jgi:hypothetical protein
MKDAVKPFVNDDGTLKPGWYYIRTWGDMESEFGIDYFDGSIASIKYAFTKQMEERMPDDRCIYVDGGVKWKDTPYDYWMICADMIESPCLDR